MSYSQSVGDPRQLHLRHTPPHHGWWLHGFPHVTNLFFLYSLESPQITHSWEKGMIAEIAAKDLPTFPSGVLTVPSP